MTDSAQTARDVLSACSGQPECEALREYLDGERDVSELSYEDVFYPLRHHHQEGLALSVADSLMVRWLVWGPGDFIYNVQHDLRQIEPPTSDPFPIYDGIQEGRLELDVEVIDDLATGGDGD